MASWSNDKSRSVLLGKKDFGIRRVMRFKMTSNRPNRFGAQPSRPVKRGDKSMRHSEPTRPSLISRVRDRDDKTSWNEFDALYRPFLYNIARRSGLSADDADDLVQDVFAKV